jgi:hypothetical protein
MKDTLVFVSTLLKKFIDNTFRPSQYLEMPVFNEEFYLVTDLANLKILPVVRKYILQETSTIQIRMFTKSYDELVQEGLIKLALRNDQKFISVLSETRQKYKLIIAISKDKEGILMSVTSYIYRLIPNSKG